MSKYIIVNGTFREVSDEELMHFKYVKRVKLPGGGYRYYYDEESAKTDEKRATYNTSKELREAERDVFNESKKYYQAKKRFDDSGLNDGRGMLINDQIKLRDDYNYSKKQLKSAEQRYSWVYNKYKMSKLGTDLNKAVSKGAVKVANFFSKLFRKK